MTPSVKEWLTTVFDNLSGNLGWSHQQRCPAQSTMVFVQKIEQSRANRSLVCGSLVNRVNYRELRRFRSI
jgi:hypothetical protein